MNDQEYPHQTLVDGRGEFSLGLAAMSRQPADLAAARACFEKAAQRGHPGAMYELATLLATRLDPPDPGAACSWFEQAAHAGNVAAMIQLGVLSATRAQPPDVTAARFWFERAARSGDTDAMLNLGLLLVNLCTPPDFAAAREWWTRAAEAGDARGAAHLATLPVLAHRNGAPPEIPATGPGPQPSASCNPPSGGQAHPGPASSAHPLPGAATRITPYAPPPMISQNAYPPGTDWSVPIPIPKTSGLARRAVVGWFLKVLRQYADFSGRARRREYWMFTLVNIVLMGAILSAGLYAMTLSEQLESLTFSVLGIYFLAVLTPTLAVTTRRLHDVGKTGWWQLLCLLYPIPLIGLVASLVMLVWCVSDGNRGPNEYGPDPKDISQHGPYPQGAPV